MKHASGGMSIRRHGEVSPERRYKAHLPGKGLPRPSGSECILAEVSFRFFFFKLWRINIFAPLKYQHFLKPKNMLSSPKYQRKRKRKQELKFVGFLHIFTPPALAFVSPFSTHKDTHTHTAYIQPLKHLKRKDHFIWSITDKQDKVLFRNSQLQKQRVLIYKRS